MGPVIAEDCKGKVLELSGIDDAEVEIVWDPPLDSRYDFRGR